VNQKKAAASLVFIDEEMTMQQLKGDPRAVSLMEKRLLDIIVRHNLYKDEQIDMLFAEFRRANKELDQKQVEEALAGVKRTMDE
jgi:hypothetical protein